MNPAGFPDYVIQGPLASIPFNSGTPDALGNYWYMDGELGGWDSPDMRATMLPKIGSDPSADGEYAADLHYRGRTLTFKLSTSCPSESAREAARYLLAEALDLVNVGGLFLANEEVPKQLVVQRTGNSGLGKLVMTEQGLSAKGTSTPDFPTADPDSNGVVYLLEAEIELYAADPRKYAQTLTVGTIAGSAVTLVNDGNTQTQNLVLTIDHGISNMHITVDIAIAGWGTMVLTVPTLPADAPPAGNFPSILHIDAYNKTLISGSGDNYYYLRDLRYPWLAIPPGSHVLTLAGGLGDPDGSTISYASAWI